MMTLQKTLFISTALGFIFTHGALADATDLPEEEIKKLEAESAERPIAEKKAEFAEVLQAFEDTAAPAESNIIAPDINEAHQNLFAEENIVVPEIIETQPTLIAEETIQVPEFIDTKPTLIAEEQPLEIQEEGEIIAPQTLATVEVDPRPQIQTVPEEELAIGPDQNPAVSKIEVVSLASAEKGRLPMGILESNRDPSTQKWYLFSSAKRGIKDPSDTVDVVTIVDQNNPQLERGEIVKTLLTDMGISRDKIRVIAATGNDGQAGRVYIYGAQ